MFFKEAECTMNHPLLNIAIQAARSAGKLIARSLDHLEAGDITAKQKQDFVARVETAAEEEIVAIIREAYSEHAILSAKTDDQKNSADTQWIIAPLSGANNFMHGLPHFAVSIAVKAKNQLETSMIFDPIKNELFVAARGRGAMLNNRKIRVSSCLKLDTALIATGGLLSESESFQQYSKRLANLIPQVAGVRNYGSSALDLAYVAAGRFDGYVEFGVDAWDIAAGALIVKEAGGLISDNDGKEDYLKNGNAVAANLKLHAMLLAAN